VVPETFETDRGLRHKCPECGKFMKPLTPGDGEEAPLEDPKEGARRMLGRGKITIEKIMAETGLTRPVVTCLKGPLAKKGELPSHRGPHSLSPPPLPLPLPESLPERAVYRTSLKHP